MQNSDLIQRLQPFLQQAEITIYHEGRTLHITDVEALFNVPPQEALAVLIVVEERAQMQIHDETVNLRPINSLQAHFQVLNRSKRATVPVKITDLATGEVSFQIPCIRLHIDEAQAQGFVVDTHCYPYLAYKGERFRPTETQEVYTELESELIRREAKSLVEFTNAQLGEPWRPGGE